MVTGLLVQSWTWTLDLMTRRKRQKMLKLETLDSIENIKLRAPEGTKQEAEQLILCLKEVLRAPSQGNIEVAGSAMGYYQSQFIRAATLNMENEQ